MGHPQDKAYLQPYREAVERFGPGFEATLWNTREAQTLRFDVMADLADFTGRTILDVGCGPGDLAARLGERGVAYARFVGIDAIEGMVEVARKRGLPRCDFLVGDALADPGLLGDARPDWVCLSGTLNTMDEDTARRLIRTGFEAATRGVVFNFLSSRHHRRLAGHDTAPARRFDPLRWLDFALTLSSRVAFTQTYLDGHDATIMIEKDLLSSDPEP